MPDKELISILGEPDSTSTGNELTDILGEPDVKKKEVSGDGLLGGKSTIPDQASLLPGYDKIAKTGKIPVNPFEKAALGQPAIDEAQPVDSKETVPAKPKPVKEPSVYDQALEDTEKWYGKWPSPRKKLASFNQIAAQTKAKYQFEVDKGFPIDQVNANMDAELENIAKQQGLLWDSKNREPVVPQSEIDRYEETYKLRLGERLSKIAESKRNPYIKDVLGNLGSGSTQVLATPFNLLAISEKAGNAMLKPLGADPSTYWQDFSKYITENQAEMTENSKRYDEDIISLAKNGETGKAIGAAVLQTAQTLPMLSALIMGNAAGATKTALGFMGTSTAAQEYMSNNDKKDIGEFYKIIDAMGAGLAEVVFEQAGTVKILQGIKKGIEERGANIVQEELTNMFRTSMERNVAMIMQGNSDMVREGLSEGMTQFAQNWMAKATVDPNRNLWEGVNDATIVGALIGKGINLALNTANKVQTAGIRKSVRETIEKIPEDYSSEAKEKLVPLILERDHLKEKIADAAEPIKQVYSPQIKVIDNAISKISAKEEGIELPEEEKPTDNENKAQEASIPESEVKVSSEGITPLDNGKGSKKGNEPEGEELQTPETMMRDLLAQGYTPERAQEMIQMFGEFTEGYTYTPEEFAKAKEEGTLPKEESPVLPTEKGKLDRMAEIEKAINENGYGLEVEPDNDPDMTTINVKIGEANQDIDKLPQGIKDLVNEFTQLTHEVGITNLQEDKANATQIRTDQGQADTGGNTNTESEGNRGQKIQQGTQAGTETGNQKAGLDETQIHNGLVSNIRNYNSIPRSHTVRRREVLKTINAKASQLGYSISQKNGKLSVLREGKPIRTIATRQTKEQIESHKALVDYDENVQGTVNKLIDHGLTGIQDTGLNKEQIDQAIRDIKSGKKSSSANRLLDHFENAVAKDEIVFAIGDEKRAVGLQDLLKATEESQSPLNEKETEIVNNLEDDIDPNDLESIHKAFFDGRIFTEEEFNDLQTYIANENQIREQQEAADGVEEESGDREADQQEQGETRAAKEARVKLDAEIADYEKQLTEAKVRRDAKIKEFHSRNGLFGDVKNEKEGAKLFQTESDFSQDNLNRMVRPEQEEINKLETIIEKLKKNKEQKIKEAGGQTEMEEAAFATQKKGKKPPLSKKKGVAKPEPGKSTGPEKKEPPRGPWIDEEKMTNEGLKGIEAPELVEMFRKLTGKFPGLKNFVKKLGVFYHYEGGDFKIVLNRILFTKDGVEMLGRVIAHEFGHFIDSMPGITLKRGNILGRIASLKDYFTKTLGEKPGKEDTVLTDKDREYLRKEAEKSLKEEYNKGIREIIEEIIEETPIFEQTGLTAQDIVDIWRDNNVRETNPELYEYVAKLSSFQKARIMRDALKGLIDSEIVKKFSKGKQVGTKITKKQIKKIVTPPPVTPIEIAKKYRELLREEINKRRLFEEEIIRDELERLTQWWNPFDVKQDKEYTKYRFDSKELYAEALSVLFNNPQAVAERAPFFNRAFFNYFENKPTIKAVYDEMQDLLNKPREELLKDRMRRMFEGFKRGEKKRKAITEKKHENKLSWWEIIQKDFLSLIIPIVKRIPEGSHLTKALNDRQFLRDALEKMAFANEKIAVMLAKMDALVIKELERAGLTFEDFSAVLSFDRQLGDRKYKANPYAFQEQASAELKAFIESNLSGKQLEDMNRIIQNFHDAVFDITEEAYKAGIYSTPQYEMISKNRNTYVTYAVVDYIDKNAIGVAFKKATGTLKEHESPYVSTLFKLASMIKAIERQNAVNTLMDVYNEHFPNEIKETKVIRVKGIRVGERPAENKSTVQYWKDGKWSSIDVDPYIAEFFDLNKMKELDSVTRLFRTFNKGFKPLVTTWNVGWAFFSNILRDHPRTFYNLFAILGSMEGISKLELVKLPFTYLKSIVQILPQSKQFVNGQLTPMIEEMIKQGVLRHGFFGSYDPHVDEPAGPLYQKYGLIQKDKTIRDRMAERSKMLKYGLKILSGIEYAGQILEVSSKMTAFNILDQKLKDAKSAGFYTRNYAGTPNYLDKGTFTRTTNEVFTFSNVILQAIRTDAEIALKPQTRGAYWTGQAIGVITPAALMSLAAVGLFGDELEDLYGQLTEYEKTNYLCVIWGKTKDGKPVYTKLPIPEFSRISHAITYKIIANAMDKDGMELSDITDILSVGTSMTPSPSPLLKTALGWSTYLAGKNPYDFFYGEQVLTERQQEARGWPALNKMVNWSLKNVGGTFIVKMYDYDPLKNTTTEYTLQNIPLVSRMIKIGGRGQTETLSKAGEKIRGERAKESLKKDKVINEYVLKAISEGKDFSQSEEIIKELKKEIYGTDQTTPEQNREFSFTKKKFKTKLIKGIHSPFSNAASSIIDSQSNDEKTAKLEQYALIYGEDKFIELISYLDSQELISRDLKGKLKFMVEGIDLDEQKRDDIIQILDESDVKVGTFERQIEESE